MKKEFNEKNLLLDLLTEEKNLSIFLINGIKLQGRILSYNDSCIRINGRDSEQIIYKHAISTIAIMSNSDNSLFKDTKCLYSDNKKEIEKEFDEKKALLDLSEREKELSIFLINGIKLQGRILSCNDLSIKIHGKDSEQVIYKHAISTITSANRVRPVFKEVQYPINSGDHQL